MEFVPTWKRCWYLFQNRLYFPRWYYHDHILGRHVYLIEYQK